MRVNLGGEKTQEAEKKALNKEYKHREINISLCRIKNVLTVESSENGSIHYCKRDN